MNNIVIKNFTILLLVVFCFNNVKCEIDNCNFHTCSECIGVAQDTCVWCAQETMKDRRCRSLSSLNKMKSWCEKESIHNPKSRINVIKNNDFNEATNAQVQFKPQLIEIEARPGVPITINMSYKPAKDYPLDVYYLMDTSFTMKLNVNDLKKQATQIYTQLKNYTNNVLLGVGSFVEKPGFPYVDFNVKHESYAFKNHQSLTLDIEKFQSTISNIRFGSNYDGPEAGLDGLMQVMKCNNTIRWREGARRIIVLCTDSTYHSAGDGKIVGAIIPNDMQCHLKNDIYTESLKYDYPSVSQINNVAIAGNFKIIFAVKQKVENEYKALAKQILGAKYAKLGGDSSVIQIIKEAYEESARTVEIRTDLKSNYIQLTIDQDCKSKPKRNCESQHTEPIVNIPATLKVMSCPTDGKLNHEIKMWPFGINELLMIKLKIKCNCDCEKTSGAMSPKCYNEGFMQCGVCKCNQGRYGVDCRCSGASTDMQDTEKCKLNVNETTLCSGRGNCRCGKCETCRKGFSGDYCEFDDNSCPRPDSKLCFGKGQCRRGQCECDAHWTGHDCSCPDHDLDCIAPYSKKVCSGNGKCNCGVCYCDKLDSKNETYSGVFCDVCAECAEQRCKELENYALCNYEHMGNQPYCDSINNVTTSEISVHFVNKTEINGPQWYMAKWCKKEFDNGTYLIFKYQYDDHDLTLVIQNETELPPKAPIWIAAGTAIGLVLLIGIITVVVWKILVDLHDKREYEKFSKAAASEGYDVTLNPLFVPPNTVFLNPVCN